MASTALAFFLFILSIHAVHHAHCAHQGAAAAPAPAVDCSTLILNMADCLTFVSAGSTVAKPEPTCCSGLKTVLKANAECLCEAFKSSASFGVTLNVSKALTLPSACKVSATSASKCNLSLGPASAPGMSPGAAMTPTMSVGANEQAPAPSPGVSGSSVVFISVGSLITGIVAALFYSF